MRRNVNSLGAQLESLKAGVARMKALPASDPRSWRFQADIHGTHEAVTNPLFQQCKHDSQWFLAWHRGYLHYFERILRWASGDPTLCLPYWDWTYSPSLPGPFRLPADSRNPLYEASRSMNDGSGLAAEIVVVTLGRSLAQRDFSIAHHQVGFTWGMENSPHGTVHGAVGGLMADIPMAANDPIFWLHHGNIDRLWDYWLNLGEGRGHLDDPTYLSKEFSYADENGKTVTHQVRELLHSARLGYRYDNVPNPPPIDAMPAPPMHPMGAGQHPPSATPLASSAQEGWQAGQVKPLGFRTEAVRLQSTSPQARPEAAPSSPASPVRILLRVEGITFDARPGFAYGVYLNVPDGQEPSERAHDHLVGTLNFIGKHLPHDPDDHAQGIDPIEGFSQSFDITNFIPYLRRKGLWSGADRSRVHFRPITIVPPKGQETATARRAEESARRANVRYRKVQILEVR